MPKESPCSPCSEPYKGGRSDTVEHDLGCGQYEVSCAMSPTDEAEEHTDSRRASGHGMRSKCCAGVERKSQFCSRKSIDGEERVHGGKCSTFTCCKTTAPMSRGSEASCCLCTHVLGPPLAQPQAGRRVGDSFSCRLAEPPRSHTRYADMQSGRGTSTACRLLQRNSHEATRPR